MKRASLLLASALLFSLFVGTKNHRAQTPPPMKESRAAAECSLSLEDAPMLLGMRLGMSLEETKTVAPSLGLSRRIRKTNGISTSLSSRPNEVAEGVVNRYLDDKLFEIDILYNSVNSWNSTAEFVREFSQKFNLPEQAWTKTNGSQNYLLTCQGFTIEARDQNHIILSDATAAGENQKRADGVAVKQGSP